MFAVERVLDNRGIKQTWLAERLGVHPSYVSKMMSGERPWTAGLRRKCAEILALPEDVLFLTLDVGTSYETCMNKQQEPAT